MDHEEVWRQVPPEEKLELMNKANGRAILSVVAAIIAGSTLAVSLRAPWLLWGILLLSPIIYQVVAGKAWRALKPKAMLEFLAARSAARRVAFSVKGQNLTLQVLFKGLIEKIPLTDEEEREIRYPPLPVWVALFGDSVVILREHRGGARVEFCHLTNDKLEVSIHSPSGQGEYSQDAEVIISQRDYTKNEIGRYKVTSAHPAALVVFAKKLQHSIKNYHSEVENFLNSATQTPELFEEEEDTFFRL